MEVPIKTLDIIFKNSHRNLVLLLEGILETEIVLAKPYDMPVLIITYRGLKQEYFSFIKGYTAQKLKDAIDEKRDYVILEDI